MYTISSLAPLNVHNTGNISELGIYLEFIIEVKLESYDPYILTFLSSYKCNRTCTSIKVEMETWCK